MKLKKRIIVILESIVLLIVLGVLGLLVIEMVQTKKLVFAVGIVLLSIIILTVGTVAIMYQLSMQEHIRPVETRNTTGTAGTAFVAFKPGLSSFQENLVEAFIEGLIEKDWKVKVTTTSSETPVINASEYDLFVTGSPGYGSKPHPHTVSYIEKLDLEELDTVVIMSTGGGDNASLDLIVEDIKTVNGNIIGSFMFSTMAPNEDDPKSTLRSFAKNISIEN